MAVSKMLTKQKGPSIMVERPIKYICQYVSFKRANSYTIVGDDDMHQITQLWLKKNSSKVLQLLVTVISIAQGCGDLFSTHDHWPIAVLNILHLMHNITTSEHCFTPNL